MPGSVYAPASIAYPSNGTATEGRPVYEAHHITSHHTVAEQRNTGLTYQIKHHRSAVVQQAAAGAHTHHERSHAIARKTNAIKAKRIAKRVHFQAFSDSV